MRDSAHAQLTVGGYRLAHPNGAELRRLPWMVFMLSAVSFHRDIASTSSNASVGAGRDSCPQCNISVPASACESVSSLLLGNGTESVSNDFNQRDDRAERRVGDGTRRSHEF